MSFEISTETDSNGVTKSYYNDNISKGCPNAEYPTVNVENWDEQCPNWHPYPTSLREPVDDTPTFRDWDFTWDYYTGLRTWEIDMNSGVTTSADYDLRGRQISLNEAGARMTRTIYNDSPAVRKVTVYKDLDAFNDENPITSETTMDNRGKVYLSHSTDDNGSLGISSKSYDRIAGGYSYKLASNPFRTTGETTMGWTRTKLDTMNRVIEVAHFTGDDLPSPWGSNNNSTGAVTTTYGTIFDSSLQQYGYTETITDEAGKVRTLGVHGHP
jgi:hypothetical protein